MRPACSRILCGLFLPVASVSPSPAGAVQITVHSTGARSTGLGSWLDSLLHGPLPPASSHVPGARVATVAARLLSTRTGNPSDGDPLNHSHSNAGIDSDYGNSGLCGTSGAVSVPAAAHARQPTARSKSARQHHARVPAGPSQPPSRGPKEKAAKVPSAKAAAAMAAAKAGGQQPLTREARLQLDAQLGEMSMPQPPYRGRSTDGRRTVHVTGFYIGHSFTRSSTEAVAARFRSQPLARGVTVAGEYYDHEDALIILHQHQHLAPSTHSPPPLPAPGRAAAHQPPPDAGAAAGVAATAPGVGSEASARSAGAAQQLAADAPAPPPSAPELQAASLSAPEASPPTWRTTSTGAAAAGAGVTCTTAGTGAMQPLAATAAEGFPPAPPLTGPCPGASHIPSSPPAEWELEAGTTTVASCTASGSSEATAAGPVEPIHGSSVSGSSKEDTVCMAVMLLEYGGVVFFNIPESLHSEALALVAAAALSDEQLAATELQLVLPRQPPLRPGSGRAEMAGWRQAVADKLSLHKEEQVVVVDPTMLAGRGAGRWIRKLDDSLRIWAWDSTNLESIARVLSQSAAIRYYNQECEDMLERYETIMPLGYEPSDRVGTLERLLFWRSRLPLRDLRQMVFKSSGIRVRLDSRLGLRDPPSGTWESTRHHAVWDAMRREFELDDRRDNLMEKTDLLKQSCLDLISANNESFTKRSELSIILLITAEIVISLSDLHGALSAANVGGAVAWALDWVGLGASAAADTTAVGASAGRDVLG